MFCLYLFLMAIFAPMTPCHMELRTQRYEMEIAGQFPPLSNGRPSVHPRGILRNMYCHCESDTWMICQISCRTRESYRIVTNRLSGDDDELLPFFMMNPNPAIPGWELLCYQHPDCNPAVFAMISIHTNADGNLVPRRQRASYDPDLPSRSGTSDVTASSALSPPVLGRSWSWPGMQRTKNKPKEKTTKEAPTTYHYPQNFMPISLCTDGSLEAECPITRMPFEPRQIVYVLKLDEDKVAAGKSVACISAEGLMLLQRSPKSLENGGFKDPLKRTGEIYLSIKSHYTAYILYDDSSCSKPASEEDPKH